MIRSNCVLRQAVGLLYFVAIGTANGNAGQDTTGKTGDAAPHQITIAAGSLQLTAPKEWTVQQPLSRIVAHEFAIPAAEGDAAGGRLTIMGAGGTIEANIERWLGQFTQPDGSSTKDKATITEEEIAGQKVRFVDLTGTFQDRPRGPFGPVVTRKEYRMLAAIVQTKRHGNQFIKLYGPANTIASAEKEFRGFVESLQVTK